MKKRLFLIVLISLCIFPLSAKSIDVVVMLDTSESVLPIYEDLVNYIVEKVLSNHVRFGDTFHLISFDAKPDLIYSRQLQDSDDLEEVVAALFLLNPLGKHTDLIMALKYLNQHVSSLSDSGNSEVIILTDGIHDPPPGSPFMSVFAEDAEGNRINLLEQEIKSITRNGINVSLVKLPVNGKTGKNTGSESSMDGTASEAGTSTDAAGTGISSATASGTASSDASAGIGSSSGSQDNTASLKDRDKTGVSDDHTASENNGSASLSGTGIPKDPASSDAQGSSSDNQGQAGSSSAGSADNNIFSFTDSGSSKIYQTDFTDDKDGNNTATGSPRIKYPEKLGKIKYHFSLPVEIENFYDKPILLKLDKAVFDGIDILKEKINVRLKEKQNKKVSIDMLLPYSIEPGSLDIDLKLIFTDRNRAYPENAVIKAELKKSLSDFIKDLNIVFKIIFIAAIAVVLLIFFIIFFGSFVHISVRESNKRIKKDFEEMTGGKGMRPLALKVIGQNDYRIGTGNIHSFKENDVKSLGGGHSAYHVFLYKLPSHIAEVIFTGGRYTLAVKDKNFFPDIKEDEKEIVTEEIINIKTENSMIIECYFYEYISPLEKINTIMKLTDHRGMPENRISIYTK